MTKRVVNNFRGLPDIPISTASLLLVVASLCFSNSWNGDFVFDDSEAIVNNEDVRDAPLFDIFRNDFWGTKMSHEQSHKSYRPLTIFSFRMHYMSRGGLDPRDFHVFNIMLHVGVSLLTMFIFRLFLCEKDKNVSFFGALLFAVHPVHAEAVAGIVGRADILCCLFMWFSVFFYHESISAPERSSKLSNTASCLVCVAAAMLCKETGITAIGICCVYDIVVIHKILPMDAARLLRLGHWEAKHSDLLRRLLAMLAAAFLLLLARFALMGFSAPVFKPVDNPASFSDRLVTRALSYNHIYALNAWLLLCPDWLCFDWSMGCVPLVSGADVRLLGVLGLWVFLGLFSLPVLSGRSGLERSGQTLMALALVLLPFLPATNLLFRVGFVVAERTLYIPSAGFCLLVATGLQRLAERFGARTLAPLYVALVALFFARSWTRSEEWKEERTLFQSGLRVCPMNAKVHYNVGKNAADSGNSTHAEIEYREALRWERRAYSTAGLNPDYAQAMNNLGNLLKDKGNHGEAEKLFLRAIALQEDFAAAWMNLGIVLAALGRHDQAERSYLTAISHRPKYPDCFYNLGVLYLERKEHDRAMMAWENATRQKPRHKRAWTNKILLLDDLGHGEKALAMGNRALEHLPEEASIYFNVANILGKAGRFEEAEEQFEAAISRDAKNPTYLTNLGVLYHRWNKPTRAEKMYKRALALSPGLKSARDNLKKLKILGTKVK